MHLFRDTLIIIKISQIVDEYTYAQYLDPATYKERMVKHWDTFYQKEDFEKLYNCKHTNIEQIL